jgi:hypothetical protein
MKLYLIDQVNTTNRSAFAEKVVVISKALGINPNYLMAVMHFESKLDPSAVNPRSGASGLIQFTRATAKGLGTSVEQIRRMSAIAQLDLVLLHMKPYARRIKSFVDVYLSIFFPAAIGKPDNYVLKTSRLSASLIASQNPVFDLNKDDKITKSEVARVILSRIPPDDRNLFDQKKNNLVAGGYTDIRVYHSTGDTEVLKIVKN